jgi:uncharacterized membrane protein
MSWAYFHIVINHFPIVGVIIGTLLLVAGLVFRNEGVNLAGSGTIVFSSFTAIIAYLTGNPAEKSARGIPDVVESLISRHENIATIGMYLIVPAGLIAAVAFYSVWKKERSVRLLVLFTLVLSLISSIAMIYVGRTGGQIRHSEFRNESSNQYILEHQNEKPE